MHSKLGAKVKLRKRMCIGQYETASKQNFRSVTVLSGLCKTKNVTDDSAGRLSYFRIETIDNRGCFFTKLYPNRDGPTTTPDTTARPARRRFIRIKIVLNYFSIS